MPITKSAKRALRQNATRRLRNLKRRNKLRSLVDQERKLLDRKNLEEAKTLLPQLYKALDKAAKQGIIPKNTAARKKSRFAKLLKKTADPKA